MSIQGLDQNGQYPPLVFGCASFGYGTFTSKPAVTYETCFRLVRLAFRTGISAFDTGEHGKCALQRLG